MGRLLAFVLVFISCQFAFSQNGNFRSRVSGNWATPATWERDADGNGSYEISPSDVAPNSSSGTILVQAGHNVSVNANVTTDQTTVENMGLITVNAVLTVADGPGNDLVNSGAVRTTDASQLIISNNATFEHQRNAGYIPLATWNDFSTCLVTGVTAAAPTNLTQPSGFYNFIWNSSGQTKNISLGGTLVNVRGNFEVQNTATFALQLATTSAPLPVDIGGNLIVSNLAKLSFTTTAATTVNIDGNFQYLSTSAAGSVLKDAGNSTLNVQGNFEIDAVGGLLNLSSGTGAFAINLSGAFSLLNGTVSETGAGSVTFNFIGTEQQTFTNNGSILNSIGYAVNATSSLEISGESAMTGSNLLVSGTLTVNSSNPTGAIVTGTAAGNVRTTTRTYDPGATIIYGGNAAQFIGNGHPSSASVTTVIDNNSGVAFNTTTSGNVSATELAVANIVLANGNLLVQSTATARTLSISGTVQANGNAIDFSGANSSLTVTGTGDFGTFPLTAAPEQLLNFIYNRSGNGDIFFTSNLSISGAVTLTNGDAFFSGSTTVTGNVTVAAGARLYFDNGTLTLQGNYTSTGGSLSANANSRLFLTGANTLSSPITFTGGNTLKTLSLNKTNAGVSAVINSALTITDSLTLLDGVLQINPATLSLQNDALIVRHGAGSISSNSPVGGPWNVSYIGTSLTTGLEIPAGGAIIDLTANVNSNAVITSNQALSLSGNYLSIAASGAFTGGANAITIAGSFTNNSTFNAPTTTLSLSGSGTFTNNGVFNATTGALVVSGTYSFGGSTIATTNFNDITIQNTGALTAPGTFNILGNFTNNGTFNANNGAVAFVGSVGSKTVSGSANTQFYNLILNKTNAGNSVTISGTSAVANTLTLTDGILTLGAGTLSMNAGSTLIRNSNGSIASNRPVGGPWNLIYTGTSLSSGFEIPASGIISSLSVNSSGGAVALTQSLQITNALTISSSATFTSSTNSVTAGSVTNSGIFNLPSASSATGLTLNGSLVNNGTINAGNGIVNIAGASTFSGSNINTTTFNSVTVANGGSFTAPSTLNLSGNFTNNGSFNANAGTIVFSGSVSRHVTGTTNSLFNNITMDKTAGIQLRFSSAQTITGTLSLLNGVLNGTTPVTMQNGSTILKNSNASIATTPVGGPWNLIYSGASANSGVEIPPSGSLLSLTLNLNSGAGLTLTQNLSITNAIVINPQAVGPTFNSGTMNVSTGSITNGGTFVAPALPGMLTISGDIQNNGSFTSTGTILFNGVSTISGSQPIVAHNITIAGTLTAPVQLALGGNFVNNGTFNAAGGTLVFNGSATQQISGSTVTNFNNLQVSNTASPGLSFESDQNLVGRLTLGANVQVDADGSSNATVLTLRSTAEEPTQDASIAPIPSTSSVIGNVTVERFVTAADNMHRFISSPVTNATVEQLQDDFSVTGNFTGSSYPCTGCTSDVANLKWYNEPTAGPIGNGYRAMPAPGGTNQEQLVPGRGYDAYLWNGVSDFVVDLRGPINQGTINYTVTHSVSNPVQPLADGWNMLGNPFPSAIQWNNGGGWARSSSIDENVWVWDALQQQWLFASYNSGGTLTNGILPTGQVFWVYVEPGGGSLAVNEEAKYTGAGGTYYRTSSDKTPESPLTVIMSRGDISDHAELVLDELATPAYEKGKDVYKPHLGFEFVSVTIVDGGKNFFRFVTNAEGETQFSINVNAANNGEAELSFIDESGKLEGYMLYDKFMATYASLSDKYSFSIGDEPESKGERFLITKNLSLPVGAESKVVRYYPNPASDILSIEVVDSNVTTAVLLNSIGQVALPVDLSMNSNRKVHSVDIRSLPSGMYFLKVSTVQRQNFTYKIIKK